MEAEADAGPDHGRRTCRGRGTIPGPVRGSCHPAMCRGRATRPPSQATTLRRPSAGEPASRMPSVSRSHPRQSRLVVSVRVASAASRRPCYRTGRRGTDRVASVAWRRRATVRSVATRSFGSRTITRTVGRPSTPSRSRMGTLLWIFAGAPTTSSPRANRSRPCSILRTPNGTGHTSPYAGT